MRRVRAPTCETLDAAALGLGASMEAERCDGRSRSGGRQAGPRRAGLARFPGAGLTPSCRVTRPTSPGSALAPIGATRGGSHSPSRDMAGDPDTLPGADRLHAAVTARLPQAPRQRLRRQRVRGAGTSRRRAHGTTARRTESYVSTSRWRSGQRCWRCPRRTTSCATCHAFARRGIP